MTKWLRTGRKWTIVLYCIGNKCMHAFSAIISCIHIFTFQNSSSHFPKYEDTLKTSSFSSWNWFTSNCRHAGKRDKSRWGDQLWFYDCLWLDFIPFYVAFTYIYIVKTVILVIVTTAAAASTSSTPVCSLLLYSVNVQSYLITAMLVLK